MIERHVLDDWDGTEAQSRLAARARQAYLQQALNQILLRPLQVHKSHPSICVIVFGRIAFLNRAGALSVALHDRGVLTGIEGGLLEQIESLPIRPTGTGIRSIASYVIYEEAARSLSIRSGGLIDLRLCDSSDWSIEGTIDSEESLLESDAKQAASGLAMANWTKIARQLSRMLCLDRLLVRASKWAILGAYNALDAYDQLRTSQLKLIDVDHAKKRALAANAISAAIADGLKQQDLDDTVRWFRMRLAASGVTRLGWQLLLESKPDYWRKLALRCHYDVEFVALILILAQKLLTPSLPNYRFVAVIQEIALEQDLGNLIGCVPPQVWRRAYERFEEAGSQARSELDEVIPWAAKLGAEMPKSLRNASWATMTRRAIDDFVVELLGTTVQMSSLTPQRFEHEETTAFEVTTQNSARIIGRLMNNCLEAIWPEIEAHSVKVYFAVFENERAVISLRPRSRGLGWRVDEIRGPSNRAADVLFRDFSARLCSYCNPLELSN